MKKAICAICKDERKYFREWLEHHVALGFDKVHIFEDWGSVSHRDLTMGIEQAKIERIEDLDIPKMSGHGQYNIYNWFANKYREDYDWIAFIDLDEYIVLQEGVTLEGLLSEYADKPALGLYWRILGASGLEKNETDKRKGVFTNVCEAENWFNSKRYNFKSIVNCHLYEGWDNIHQAHGVVDVNGKILNSLVKNEPDYSKAWIDHYYTGSWEDYVNKFRRGHVVNDLRRFDDFFLLNPDMLDKREALLDAIKDEDFVGTSQIAEGMPVDHGNLKFVRAFSQFVRKQNKEEREMLSVKNPAGGNRYECLYSPIGEYDGKTVIGIRIPKCANTTLMKMQAEFQGFDIEADDWRVHDESIKKGVVVCKHLDQYPERIVFRVVRDPIERFISAWKTTSWDKTWEEYLDIFHRTLEKVPAYEHNAHIAPQFDFPVDESVVDDYVRQEDLDDYLRAHGLEPLHSNVSNALDEEHEIPDEVREYYKHDYEVISTLKFWKKDEGTSEVAGEE